MHKIKNFIQAHEMSKCSGSYRKGVIIDEKICRMFINFTTSKMDKHNENYTEIYYAGRGKKDKDKYFIEDTINNKENIKMKNNKDDFPIYIKNNNGYFYLGQFKIIKIIEKKQYNPNLKKYLKTIGFQCLKL